MLRWWEVCRQVLRLMHRYSLNMKSIDEKVSLDGDFSSALNMAKERLGIGKELPEKAGQEPTGIELRQVGGSEDYPHKPSQIESSNLTMTDTSDNSQIEQASWLISTKYDYSSSTANDAMTCLTRI